VSRRSLILILIVGVLTVAAASLAAYGFYAGRIFYVPSGPMMNTIIPGDRVMARRFSREVKRGQVVVFQYPGDETYYLGRVIGLPNETLEVRGTAVYIHRNNRVNEIKVMVRDGDGEFDELEEISTEGKGRWKVYYVASMHEYDEQGAGDPSVLGPHQIPPGHYFLMGDNRDNSEDSRYRGSVPRELIWGEPFMIYYSTVVRTDEIRWDRFFKSIQ
jgi:signal peptidase I